MNSAELTNGFSFHDSKLVRIEKMDDRIVLHLDTVAAPHNFLGQESTNEYLMLDHVRLDCKDARTRKLEFWTDTIAPIDHPDPARPMKEIMENDLKGEVLEICGFGPCSGWVVWQIEANRFTLQWESQTRY